jgi:pimeloyl-ACP methyl ester carboxylesterase
VSLSPEEFREHLKRSSATAGLTLPDLELPAAHHVILRGMRFHYLDWGTAGLPPALFLHGGGLNVHTWDLVCATLKTERHCLALDQRGHGDSEWSPVMDYATESHADDLGAFVDHLGLDRFVLVGMSLGGANALAWAGTQSRRLAGLVLVDVGPETRAAGRAKIQAFTSEATPLDSVEDFVNRALAFNPRRDAALLRRSLLHNLRQTPDGKWMWKYDQRHRGRMDPAASERRRELLWSAVARVKCPTLVVRGAESDVFHDEDAEKLSRALPDGRWVKVEKAGHTVQGDNPAGLLVSLRAFLNQVAAEPRRV